MLNAERDFNEAVNGTTKWWLCAAQTFIIISVRRLQNTALTMARCRVFVLCQQTEIYEAEYQTEHNDHKHTLQENRRLRKKREEMRQQVALLQEQVVFLSMHKSTHSHRRTHPHSYLNPLSKDYETCLLSDLDANLAK